MAPRSGFAWRLLPEAMLDSVFADDLHKEIVEYVEFNKGTPIPREVFKATIKAKRISKCGSVLQSFLVEGDGEQTGGWARCAYPGASLFRLKEYNDVPAKECKFQGRHAGVGRGQDGAVKGRSKVSSVHSRQKDPDKAPKSQILHMKTTEYECKKDNTIRKTEQRKPTTQRVRTG
ncbi:hypothetical protein NDU88_005634 [Pleurodeles waltl]|uniref:Uncharacterized protein n=1 Tax=Pleurodeles waltl TaxID=8319 RepID=A0AAV7SMD8_PLEWA|nr:hypothetical protein NDU88_005634 [Pleurodeles waltl]